MSIYIQHRLAVYTVIYPVKISEDRYKAVNLSPHMSIV